MNGVEISGVTLKNPVIAASGTFGYGAEYGNFYDVSALGALCTKGLTLKPRPGNPGMRVFETASGMMNSVGLQNPGIEHFLAHELPKMRQIGTVIVANLGGGDVEEYVRGAELLSGADVDVIELNISCPNVKHGGMAFGIRSGAAAEVVRAVRNVCRKPLWVKLSPNAENIADMARTCERNGADALSLVNTFNALAVDLDARRFVFANETAGLSGPAIKPLALRMVREVCRAVSVPVIGMGGISNARDALEFIAVGAAAVQVGSANFPNPHACRGIVSGIEEYCENNGVTVEELRGSIR